MQASGVRVDCTELEAQLNRLRAKDIRPDGPSTSLTNGNYLKVGFHYPTASTNPQIPLQPTDDAPHTKPTPQTQDAPHKTSQQNNPKDWASLFRTQGPSKSMKLCHYPELQQGNNAVVELEESDLNDKTWNSCLVGYFLDGKMPFPLLCSTARKIL